MDLSSFEKDVVFDWLRTIKKAVLSISENFQKMALNSQKTNNLLQKLLQMLENK